MPDKDEQSDQTDTSTDTSTDQGDTSETDTTDWKAEAEKWKRLSRENETRFKGNAKKLEELQASAMSDGEKAVAEAEKRGRTAALTEVSTRVAAAEIKAALTGVVPDPSVIVEDINLARYVTETGDVDTDAVAALKAKFVVIAAKAPPIPGGADGGARGTPPAGQLTQDDLRRMTPEAIVKAKADGQLNDLLGVKT
jgi:hypothetical protein